MEVVTKRKLNEASPEELIDLIAELQMRLKKKNEDLARTRLKLTRAKNDVQRLRGIVTYQRQRIIKLYD